MSESTLSFLVFAGLLLPLAGAGISFLVKGKTAGSVALITSILALLCGLGLVWGLSGQSVGENGMLFYHESAWFTTQGWDVKFMLGIDGVSGLMLLLAVVLFPLIIWYDQSQEKEQASLYYGMLLLLETGVLGFFLSLDLMMFYIFFELVLIPTAFLIGIWGHSDRQRAALKFFLYTLAGSLLMLVGIIYLGIHAQADYSLTTDYFSIKEALNGGEVAAFGSAARRWVFWAFAISFAIKVPLFPLHTWQSLTYSESSTSGSIVLAALLSKMGAYGFIRFVLPFFPEVSLSYAPVFGTLAVISILYGAYLAVVQKDLKKLIAFSSLSHLGFIILGVFAMTPEAMSGAILQMFAHGFTTAGLFFLADMLMRRYPSRQIGDFQGVAKDAPAFTLLFMITLMASVGLPGLSGFVGEFMILVGAFDSMTLPAVLPILGAVGVIIAAVYLLNMFRKVMFGPAESAASSQIFDLKAQEVAIMMPLIVLMFWVGLYATPFLTSINASAESMLQALSLLEPAALTVLP